MPGVTTQKFLTLDPVSGRNRETPATAYSSGSASAGSVVALNEDGVIDPSCLAGTLAGTPELIIVGEAIAENDIVNIYKEGSIAKVRKAGASVIGGVERQADGYVKQGYNPGDTASVYTGGKIVGITSLDVGTRYFLSTVLGQVTAVPPADSGALVQYIGRTTVATTLIFEPDVGDVRA